jgi:hypothetical protein
VIHRLAFGWLLAAAMTAVPAVAQEPETRQATWRQAREQKATQLEAYKPSGAERVLLWLENSRSWERLLNPAEGFYPKIGHVTAGSSLSLGLGYRHAFAERAAFSTVALGSFTRYWLVDTRLTFSQLADGRLFAEAYARTSDFPNEPFFGVGPLARRESESFYGLRNTRVGGSGGIRFGPYLSIGGGGEYLTPRIDPGTDSRSVRVRFPSGSVPGINRQPDFAHYSSYVEVNTREPRGNPRIGGLYALRYDQYSDRDLNAYSFGRVEAEVQQYLSLFNQRRVIALRALVSSDTTGSGQDVPFYLQNTLGGPDDLRGFRRNRFRDRNVLLLQAEYRWEVFTAMDAALFVDAGKVAPDRDDLNFTNLEHDYGFGVRFGSDTGVFLRVEGAYGSRDGRHFILRFGDAF